MNQPCFLTDSFQIFANSSWQGWHSSVNPKVFAVSIPFLPASTHSEFAHWLPWTPGWLPSEHSVLAVDHASPQPGSSWPWGESDQSPGSQHRTQTHTAASQQQPSSCLHENLTDGASLVAQVVKNLPTMREIQVRSLGQEDSLEKGMATHSSILAWRIPWTEELAGNSPRGCKKQT